MIRSLSIAACVLAAAPACVEAAGADATASTKDSRPRAVADFLTARCADCHADGADEGGFRLESLTGDLAHDDLHRWVRVLDRVRDGEMPPESAGDLNAGERDRFLSAGGQWLKTHQERAAAAFGRVRGRRLTAIQLERTLHDLLGIDSPLAPLMPEDRRTAGFTTVADGQSLSHFDLSNHLTVVDAALAEARRRIEGRPEEETWVQELSPADLARKNPKVRNREPEMYKGKAVVWSAGLVFYGRLPSTRAKEDGWYRFSFDVSSLNASEPGVWGSVTTGEQYSSSPLQTLVGTFLAVDRPRTVTIEAWLPAGHMFEVRPADYRLKRGRSKGGQVGAGEMQPQNVAGIALHRAKLERIHRGADDEELRRKLVSGLRVAWDKKAGRRLVAAGAPRKDLDRLITGFAPLAFRRPVSAEVTRPFVNAAVAEFESGKSFLDALFSGYRSVLCSPRFMYLLEEPGELDDHALAARLSYFLWGTTPDRELRRLADAGQLGNPSVLRKQADRLLSDAERGGRFAEDFSREWLDLSEIDFTEPDRRVAPNWDKVLQASMVEETVAFVQRMLDEDLSVTCLVDSDFALVNERLADHYGLPIPKRKANRGELVRIPLLEDNPRGGLMTLGAVLKVTANGTETSPVLRGVWIADRLLGMEIPPPPENVPAVEPDVRGAKTIRELLAKHRSDEACASCHRKIDPAGFALEVFDPAGAPRTNYPKNRRAGRGPKVDSSGTLPVAMITDGVGRDFDGPAELQKLLASNPDRLARGFAGKLITYGTGAPPEFADRDDVARVAERSTRSDYGVRTLLHEVIQSATFRHK